MNYINYINEVVKPQEGKQVGFKIDPTKLMDKLKNRRAPVLESEFHIIKDKWLTKRDIVISCHFENLDETSLRFTVEFDYRGLCIGLGPLSTWDYSFFDEPEPEHHRSSHCDGQCCGCAYFYDHHL